MICDAALRSGSYVLGLVGMLTEGELLGGGGMEFRLLEFGIGEGCGISVVC